MPELVLIRHAPVAHGGRLIGRTDLPATLPAEPPPPGLRPAQIWCSPAQRCQQTARWLWPERDDIRLSDQLWEQDFGAWEQNPLAGLPDLGPLERGALARHRPPGGESFLDVVARVAGVLRQLEAPGPIAVLAHAGVIRAALGLAVGLPEAGLGFAIAPLSLTQISRHEDGTWAIGSVNRPLLGGDQP